jgi:hypothetical protein
MIAFITKNDKAKPPTLLLYVRKKKDITFHPREL